MFEEYSVELKQKIVSAVNTGLLVDMFGNIYTNTVIDTTPFSSHIVKFLHHLLLKGMSDDEATELLKESGKSELEIGLILNKSHSFIKEVLGKDLNVFNKDISVKMLRLLEEKIANSKIVYSEFIKSDIEYGGYKFQADEDSLASMQTYILSSEEPGFWVDSDNNRIQFSLTNLNELHTTILRRKRDSFEKLTDFKTTIKTAYNKKDWSILMDFELKF